MARPRIRILQTSDVHLAGTFNTPKSGAHLDNCLCSLEVLSSVTDEHGVDLVMIVGDLFDHARVREDLVGEVFRRLAKLPVPVVLLPGNHDVHDDTSPYGRFGDIVTDSGVHFLDSHHGSTVELFDGQLTIWARAMPEHSPAFRPLHGVPERPAEGWFVVAGHGHHVGDEVPGPLTRSSPITNDDVAATGADYVALGHWHVPSDVSSGGVIAHYSGSPLDMGRSGQVHLVDLDPTLGVVVSPLPVQAPDGGCRS